MGKLTDGVKDAAKGVGNKVKKIIKTKLLLVGFFLLGKILPIILLACFVATIFDWIIEINSSSSNSKEMRETLQISNWEDLVEIKGDSRNGYYLEFKEEINGQPLDDVLTGLVKKMNEEKNYHNVPNDIKFLKKLIKADVITKFPDLGGGPSSSSTTENPFAGKSVDEIVNNMSDEQKAGQMILVKKTDANIQDSSQQDAGGYFFNVGDSGSGYLDSLPSAIDDAKAYTEENKLIPAFYASDDEGGQVTRLLSSYPAQRTYVNSDFTLSPALQDKITDDYTKKGEELKDKGINLLLAPVADLSSDGSYMGGLQRSFGPKASITSRCVSLAVEALTKNNLACVLKHFPGYGDAANTHITAAHNSDVEISDDISVFSQGISSGASAMLVTHVCIDAIDSNNPASLSKAVYDRARQVSSSAVLMTDDLDMQFLGRGDNEANDMNVLKEKVERAVNAGTDMILTGHYTEARDKIVEMMKNSEDVKNKVTESVKRIIQLKIDKGILSTEENTSSTSADGGVSGSSSTSVIWPLNGFNDISNITSWFGYRPPEATNGIGSTDHGGIDISGEGITNQPIISSTDGTVIRAEWFGGYGNCVDVQTGDYIFRYGHMSAISVTAGQTVSQGDQLGLVGSTGNSTGAHLHYTVMKDGVAIDPLEVIPSSEFALGKGAGGISGGGNKNYNFNENQFQGAVKIRRVRPVTTDTERPTDDAAVIESENTQEAEVGEREQVVKKWQGGSTLVVIRDTELYEEKEEGSNYFELKREEGDTIDVNRETEVTYTGNYKVSTNRLYENKTQVFVEVKYKDGDKEQTGYISSVYLKPKTEGTTVVNNSGNNGTQVSDNSSSITVSSRATNTRETENKKLGDSTRSDQNPYRIAISAGSSKADANTDQAERDKTIQVAKELESQLNEYSNVRVSQTGNTEDSNNKSEQIRADNASSEFPKPDLCIEIQYNAKEKAVEGIYREGDNISKQLADIVAKEVASRLDGGNSSGYVVGTDKERRGGDLEVINNSAKTGFPSIIIAVSNDNMTDEQVKKYAEGILNGINRYLNSSHNGYTSEITTKETESTNTNSTITQLSYCPQDEFQSKLDSANSSNNLGASVLNYFTLDDSMNVVVATWSKVDGKCTYSTITKDYKTPLKKYSTPFEYLFDYYIDTNYVGFAEDLADQVINSEMVVSILDNVTTVTEHYDGEGDNVVSEICRSVYDISYVNTWFIKAYRESSFSSSYIENKESQAVLGPATLTEQSISKVVGKDEDGNDIVVYGTRRTVSNSYTIGQSKVQAQDEIFIRLYKKHNMNVRLRQGYLLQIIEMNEETTHMTDITKYLLFRTENKDYGVLTFDTSEYDLESFSSTIKIEGSDVKEKLWNALTSAGFTEKAAAAAMGNIEIESAHTWDPNVVEYGYDEFTGGIGLIQWTNSPRTSGAGRNAELRQFAAVRGKNWNDVDVQIEFLVAELSGGSADGIAKNQFAGYESQQNIWMTAEIPEATRAFCVGFERPLDPDATLDSRISYALGYYEQYRKK